jgi:hypothetical protein
MCALTYGRVRASESEQEATKEIKPLLEKLVLIGSRGLVLLRVADQIFDFGHVKHISLDRTNALML